MASGSWLKYDIKSRKGVKKEELVHGNLEAQS